MRVHILLLMGTAALYRVCSTALRLHILCRSSFVAALAWLGAAGGLAARIGRGGDDSRPWASCNPQTVAWNPQTVAFSVFAGACLRICASACLQSSPPHAAGLSQRGPQRAGVCRHTSLLWLTQQSCSHLGLLQHAQVPADRQRARAEDEFHTLSTSTSCACGDDRQRHTHRTDTDIHTHTRKHAHTTQ